MWTKEDSAKSLRKYREKQCHITAENDGVNPKAPHGTANGYNNWRCRCAPCRKAYAEYALAMRMRRRLLVRLKDRSGNRNVPHGTDNGYVWHRCRCVICRHAHAVQELLSGSHKCKSCQGFVTAAELIRVHAGITVIVNKKSISMSYGTFHRQCLTDKLNQMFSSLALRPERPSNKGIDKK